MAFRKGIVGELDAFIRRAWSKIWGGEEKVRLQ
jgi:hypothetical protein